MRVIVRRIFKKLPTGLVATFSFVIGSAWFLGMISGQTKISFDINGVGEGWVETIMFLSIGIYGIIIFWKDIKN